MIIFNKKISYNSIKSNIFYKILSFIIKFLIYMGLFIYVILGVSATLVLVEKDIVLRKDISEFRGEIEESMINKDYDNILIWLKYRPLKETDVMIDAITPKSGYLSVKVFFTLAARKLKLKEEGEALFWLQLAKYRLRYDVLRCGAAESTKTIDGLLSVILPKGLIDILGQYDSLMAKKAIRRVLDFDKKYPAMNDPEYICGAVDALEKNSMVRTANDDWDAIHRQLRLAAEEYLAEGDSKKNPLKKNIKTPLNKK